MALKPHQFRGRIRKVPRFGAEASVKSMMSFQNSRFKGKSEFGFKLKDTSPYTKIIIYHEGSWT